MRLHEWGTRFGGIRPGGTLVGEAVEGEGEVGVVGGHAVEEAGDEGFVSLALGEQAELAAEAGEVSGLKLGLEGGERGLGGVERGLLAAGLSLQQRQQALGQARQVPERDGRLVGVGVAAVDVDGAEDLVGIVGLHEGAGAVVDGLSGDGHVVGVHDSVDEAEAEPLGDERGLAGDNGVE